jgi:hypothetical protein
MWPPLNAGHAISRAWWPMANQQVSTECVPSYCILIPFRWDFEDSSVHETPDQPGTLPVTVFERSFRSASAPRSVDLLCLSTTSKPA